MNEPSTVGRDEFERAVRVQAAFAEARADLAELLGDREAAEKHRARARDMLAVLDK